MVRAVPWLILLLLFTLILFVATPRASASITTELPGTIGSEVGDVANTVLTVGVGVVEAGTGFVENAVLSPDGAGQIRLIGNKSCADAVALQSKFGSYKGHPWLAVIGILTSEPKGRITGGLGSSVGSYKHVAVINGYVNIVPDEVSTIRAPLMPNSLGIAVGVGISFLLKE